LIGSNVKVASSREARIVGGSAPIIFGKEWNTEKR